MKFGLTHRILTSALATLGVLAIVLSGALSRATTVLLLVGLVAALFVTDRFQQSRAARYLAAILPSALFGVETLRVIGGAPFLEVAVEFAAALQIVRLATRRGAMHDQQVVLLALVHLVAGTVLGGGIAYGLCLFGFLLLVPGALVLSHLRREVEGNYRQGARDRTGLPVDVPRILRSRRVIGPGFLALTSLLSLPILVFTVLLFVMFPRVGLSLLLFQGQRALRTTGFSDTVDLSGVGAIRSDPAIVLRFRPVSLAGEPPPRMVLRLRGTAFDEYRDEGQWARSTSDRAPLSRMGDEVPITRQPRRGDGSLKIELEPLDPTVLFLPPRTVALRWTSGADLGALRPPLLVRAAESTVRYEAAPERVLRYEAFVAPAAEPMDDQLSDRDRVRYLQLPKIIPARIRDLAESWTRGAQSSLEKAQMIQRHLELDYRYTLDAPSGGQESPVDHFLFTSKAGHCEFFSTAMALLLREVGVPTRNVSGFVGGTYNRFGGFYAVRQGDAHSWIEVYLEGAPQHGWVTFDPTPPAGAQPLVDRGGAWSVVREVYEAISQGWDRYVVGYDLPTQVGLFHRIRRGVESARKQLSGDKRGRGSQWRFPVRAVLTWGTPVVLVAGVAYLLWRRRGSRPRRDDPGATRMRDQRAATELWLQLEEALHARGVSRPRNVPPLRFTEQLLAERNDAISEEAFVLANRYAQARFGGLALTVEEQREFARRIAVLRTSPAWQPGRA